MIGPAGFMQAPKVMDMPDVDRAMTPRQAEAERRNEAVRAVLMAAIKPLGPSYIGELVNSNWPCEWPDMARYRKGSSSITKTEIALTIVRKICRQ